MMNKKEHTDIEKDREMGDGVITGLKTSES